MSQTTPFIIGNSETFHSKILNQERTLNIYLPKGYNASSDSFPVIYVLDGSAHEDFLHIAGLVQFDNMYELFPKAIVVGIENVNRYHDFTPTTADSLDIAAIPNFGGAADFIAFLKEEAIPFVSKNYKTNHQNTLVGQSLGGLLATTVLMKEPTLFQNYIIVSPSLWWNKQALVNSAPEFFAGNKTLKANVFLSLGKEHPVMHRTADKLYKSIKKSGNPNVKIEYVTLKDEDHATILHMAVYKGLKWLNPMQ